jgi:hypothetical protein
MALFVALVGNKEFLIWAEDLIDATELADVYFSQSQLIQIR